MSTATSASRVCWRRVIPCRQSRRRILVTDQVKVFGRVDNSTNVHYQNPTGFLQPGLGVFGGIRVANYGVN